MPSSDSCDYGRPVAETFKSYDYDFDKIDLRTAQKYAWRNNTAHNDLHNSFIRDVFHRNSQRDVGQAYTRSCYYHLYLNGQYWGLYQTQERSESASLPMIRARALACPRSYVRRFGFWRWPRLIRSRTPSTSDIGR